MATLQSYQIEKNDNEIIKMVLTNIVKMLTSRGLLSNQDIDNNIDKISNLKSDDYVYKIKLDNDSITVVRIFLTKISSTNAHSSVNEFLNKFVSNHKIVVTKDINDNNMKFIRDNFPKTEVFFEHNLMVNLLDNNLVPKYKIINQDSPEYYSFWNDYLCIKSKIPRMFVTDPVARYYNLRRGDLVRVIMPSEASVLSFMYRIVV